MSNELERNALRFFFEQVSAVSSPDNSISDSKLFRDTNTKLKTAFRNGAKRCSCAKMTWGGICEVCQGSDAELVYLRDFFRGIRYAKKYNVSSIEIQELIKNTANRIDTARNKKMEKTSVK